MGGSGKLSFWQTVWFMFMKYIWVSSPMFISRLLGVYDYVCSFIVGGLGDNVYRVVLFFLFGGFLGLRLPYIYGIGGFCLFVVFLIFPLFCGLLLSRIVDGKLGNFFSGFVPVGTPLWMAPFVCLAETLSYVVRPAVLMMRPFVNLSVGAFGGYALGMMYFSASWVLFFLVLLFFYEVFVAVVHWFIVCSMLSFSEDH